MKKPKRKTILFSELKRLSIVNRPPSPVDALGHRMTWVGFTWVDEGEAHGDEVLVVDDPVPERRKNRAIHRNRK